MRGPWREAWLLLRCIAAEFLLGWAFALYPDGEPEKRRLALYLADLPDAVEPGSGMSADTLYTVVEVILGLCGIVAIVMLAWAIRQFWREGHWR